MGIEKSWVFCSFLQVTQRIMERFQEQQMITNENAAEMAKKLGAGAWISVIDIECIYFNFISKFVRIQVQG